MLLIESGLVRAGLSFLPFDGLSSGLGLGGCVEDKSLFRLLFLSCDLLSSIGLTSVWFLSEIAVKCGLRLLLRWWLRLLWLIDFV